MSFSSNPNAEMGRTNHEKTRRDGENSDANIDSNEVEGPIDLSMPRYPNRKRETRAPNSYCAAGRRKPPPSYDVDVNEQPIDYSKKYVESNSISTIKTNYVPRNSLNKVKIDHREREKGFSQQDNKNYPYGVYAETDLDQPTDYSLRYAEDDTDDEEKQNNAYFNGNEQEDTVKTYCTEGTPYETPFNVSSATSMSDLRLEDAKDGEGSRRTGRKIIQDSRNSKDTTTVKHPPPPCKEQDEEEEKNDNEILTKETKNMSNELVMNSSSTSIEKPHNYYEEGTPGRISRGSSLSSLGCTNGPRNEDVEEMQDEMKVQTTPPLPISPIPLVDGCREDNEEDVENPLTVVSGPINDEEAAISGPEEEKGDARVVDKEGKVVTFGGEDHYAEQTPLMFSRSSSLGSLSGFEQHSIHDDRSSIVSDFSRRTSGVVSPSELPDSPTQTVPPSPRHNHKNSTNDFPSRVPPLRNFSYVKSPRSKSSVFEDNVTAFKEESTPLEFSAATSLSSLTIDDEPKIVMDTKEKVYTKEAQTVEEFLVNTAVKVENVEVDKIVDENEEIRDRQNVRTKQEQTSDAEEDDEDILAACISMGMRNSMYRQTCKQNSDIAEKVGDMNSDDETPSLVRYETSSTLDRLVVDVAAVSLSSNSNEKNPGEIVAVPSDSVRVYCTEDTPASISPVGSQSNLSALSLLSISGEIEEEEGNRLSEEEAEDDKILDDCIKAGIARALQGTNSISDNAAETEFNSPSHTSATKEYHDNDKILEDCIDTGTMKNFSENNSFPATAAVTKKSSPYHVPSTKKSELYLPSLLSSRQASSISSSTSVKGDEAPTRGTSSATSNSIAFDLDNSGDDDKILDECIRAGMARTMHGVNSFPGTAAATEFNSPSHTASTNKCYDVDRILDDCIRAGMARSHEGSNSFPGTAVSTKHHSPLHVPSTKKSEIYLSRFVDARHAFSLSSSAQVEINDASIHHTSVAVTNSLVAEHDMSGDEDTILDDCIRAGIARTLGGGISFPGNAALTKHHSPRHGASLKKPKVHAPKSHANSQAPSISKRSPIKSKYNSTTIDHDTSGDEDKILDDCIRAGMARTMHGANSFPGTAASTKFNSPRHASSTKKCQDGNKVSDDFMKIGITTNLHGSNSFPGTPIETKQNSPRHAVPTKKTEVYLQRPSDIRQTSMSSSSPARNNDSSIRRPSSARSNAVNHEQSENERILDECIKSGIERIHQGGISPSGTKYHAPSSVKKPDLYTSRQTFSTSSSSPSKSNEASYRRTSTKKSNSTFVDHDTSGDEDNILDECIKVGIARTLQGAASFPNAGVPKHSPSHVLSKKSAVYLTRPSDTRRTLSMSSQSPALSSDTLTRSTSPDRSICNAVDLDTSGDDDKILEDCIKAGIVRTLHGGAPFPEPNVATKQQSPRRTPSIKKSEVYLPNAGETETCSMLLPFTSKSNALSIRCTSLPRSNSTAVEHDRILHDEVHNHSEDEAILTRCVQTAMPKASRNSSTFAKPQAPRKTSKISSRNSNPSETSSCSSTLVTTELYRTSVTTILIPVTNRNTECFVDNSSISEDEEDLMLAQCIRAGMPRASSVPPRNTKYQREERRTREQ